MKPKFERIFCCPICVRKKSFDSINGLNNHLTKSHPEYARKITLIAKGRAQSRLTRK